MKINILFNYDADVAIQMQVYVVKKLFLFWLLAMSAFFINYLMVRIILTQYQKVKDQIDTIKRFETKIKYGVKNNNQLCNLSI